MHERRRRTGFNNELIRVSKFQGCWLFTLIEKADIEVVVVDGKLRSKSDNRRKSRKNKEQDRMLDRGDSLR